MLFVDCSYLNYYSLVLNKMKSREYKISIYTQGDNKNGEWVGEYTFADNVP